MSRLDIVNLHGYLFHKPQTISDAKGRPISSTFSIRVIRRPLTSVTQQHLRIDVDCPVIWTRDPEQIKTILTLEKGDMVDVRGVLTSREFVKQDNCPNCGHPVAREGNATFVTPLYICKREHVEEEDSFLLLKSRAEISNRLEIIGNVCKGDDARADASGTPPYFYTDSKGRTYCQFQIASARSYRIPQDADDQRTDFPWVKVYGKQAEAANSALRVSSKVLLVGAIQTRRISRQIRCGACGEVFEKQEDVAEIVPSYIGYEADCIIPKSSHADGISEEEDDPLKDVPLAGQEAV